MLELNRLSSGDFSIDMSVKLDDENLENKIILVDEAFKNLSSINVNEYMKKLIFNGVLLDERQIKTDKPFKVYCNNKLIAVYDIYKENTYKPIVQFKE